MSEFKIERKLEVRKSPWGPEDEIGRLNWVTDESIQDIMSQIDYASGYDLSVDYFVGMPSWQAAGDPGYQIFMSHTPTGNINDDLMDVTQAGKELIGYSGDVALLYTHTGTHIDGLNHFGYRGKIWNQFEEQSDLGSRRWNKCGVDKFPTFVAARTVLLDVAKAKGVDMLPDSYGITKEDIQMTLKRQGTEIKKGDIVLIRTGRMTVWPDRAKYENNSPGLNIESAEYLVGKGTMTFGADNIALEQSPSVEKDNYFPVHAYLFTEVGATIIELLWLEELSKQEIYEGGLVFTIMPLKGATGAPVQPTFFPLK